MKKTQFQLGIPDSRLSLVEFFHSSGCHDHRLRGIVRLKNQFNDLSS
jgi:hypothetical protein